MEEPTMKRLRMISEDVFKGDLGSAFERIQVMWNLAKDEEEGEYIWWDATVVGRTSRFHELLDDEEDRLEDEAEEEESDGLEAIKSLPVYEIRYDSLPPEFTSPEIGSVCLLNDHVMLDVDTDQPLSWRHFGDSWEEEDEEDEVTRAATTPPILTKLLESFKSQEVLLLEVPESSNNEGCEAMARTFVEELIVKLAEQYKTEMDSLGMPGQIYVMDRVITMREKLVREITQILQTKGRLTEQDSARIIQSISTDA